MIQLPIPLISIVIPVYKVEQYLHQCIDSVLAQTYTNFELILVDDGSPDNSGTICDDYAEKDSRIKVIHQENSGANMARKVGVKRSKGSWVSFIDADDTFYDKEVLNKLLQRAIKDKTDIVLGASLDTFPDGKIVINKNKIGSGIYDSLKYIKALLTAQCIYGPACKIIKKELFDDEIFELPKQIYQHEDMFMNIILGLSASRISIDNDIIAYNYTVSSSTSFQTSKGLMPPESWFELFNLIKKKFTEQGVYENLIREYSRYVHNFIYQSMLIRQRRFPNYKELKLATDSLFEKKIKILNKYSILWTIYFQVWRILYILKNILR